MLESLRQEERTVLRCAAREYLRRLSVIWSSLFSDYQIQPEKKTEILTPSNASGGSRNGEGTQHTQSYAIHKTQASPTVDPTCRLCSTAPESMAHVLSACPFLAHGKYLARHDAVLKVRFFDIIKDLIEASPPWY